MLILVNNRFWQRYCQFKIDPIVVLWSYVCGVSGVCSEGILWQNTTIVTDSGRMLHDEAIHRSLLKNLEVPSKRYKRKL